jgi:hypothetical protein
MDQADYQRMRGLYDIAIADTTDDDLCWVLQQHYAQPSIPPCRICGDQLAPQRVGGGEPTVYACSGRNEDGTWKTGRSFVDEHYRESHFEDRKSGGDDRVMELIARYQRLLSKAKESDRDFWRAERNGYRDAIEAARAENEKWLAADQEKKAEIERLKAELAKVQPPAPSLPAVGETVECWYSTGWSREIVCAWVRAVTGGQCPDGFQVRGRIGIYTADQEGKTWRRVAQEPKPETKGAE